MDRGQKRILCSLTRRKKAARAWAERIFRRGRHGDRSSRRGRCWCRIAAADHACAAFGAQPVTVALDRDHLTVMEQPIEDRGRHDVIAQGPAPVGESLVRRQQNAATFVTDRRFSATCAVSLEGGWTSHSGRVGLAVSRLAGLRAASMRATR